MDYVQVSEQLQVLFLISNEEYIMYHALFLTSVYLKLIGSITVVCTRVPDKIK
jgi:hypothetical protein